MKLIGRKTSVGAVVAAALMLPWIGMIAPASAHHAFAAEYDAKKHVILKGTVTKMEWINPHAWIHIDVKKPDGTLEEWMIEFGTPNTLLRRGFTRDSLGRHGRAGDGGRRRTDEVGDDRYRSADRIRPPHRGNRFVSGSGSRHATTTTTAA